MNGDDDHVLYLSLDTNTHRRAMQLLREQGITAERVTQSLYDTAVSQVQGQLDSSVRPLDVLFDASGTRDEISGLAEHAEAIESLRASGASEADEQSYLGALLANERAELDKPTTSRIQLFPPGADLGDGLVSDREPHELTLDYFDSN